MTVAATVRAAQAPGRARSVARLVVTRLVAAVVVVLGVVTLVFVISVATGQNAAAAKLGPFSSQAARDAFARANGLDKPAIVQYGHYLDRLLHGNLGTSVVLNESISHLIAKALPVTTSLAVLATLVSAVASMLLGCAAALTRDRWPDRVIRAFCSVAHSMPSFWIGLLAIQLLAVHYRIVPSGGYSPIGQGVGAWLHSMITPVLVLSLPFTAGMTRVIRISMLEELDKDYVRTAKGLGLSTREIVLRNVLRNALVAPLTVLGLSLGGLFAGAVLIEAVFRLPGIGSLVVTAVQERDFGIVAACAIVAGIAFVTVNLFVDIAQSLLSPRPAGEV